MSGTFLQKIHLPALFVQGYEKRNTLLDSCWLTSWTLWSTGLPHSHGAFFFPTCSSRLASFRVSKYPEKQKVWKSCLVRKLSLVWVTSEYFRTIESRAGQEFEVSGIWHNSVHSKLCPQSRSKGMLHIRAYKYWQGACAVFPVLTHRSLCRGSCSGLDHFPVLSLAFQAASLLTDVGPRL